MRTGQGRFSAAWYFQQCIMGGCRRADCTSLSLQHAILLLCGSSVSLQLGIMNPAAHGGARHTAGRQVVLKCSVWVCMWDSEGAAGSLLYDSVAPSWARWNPHQAGCLMRSEGTYESELAADRWTDRS